MSYPQGLTGPWVCGAALGWPPACSGETVAARISQSKALDLLDLPIFQFDRGRAAEDRHRHLEAALLFVHFLHEAGERGERAVVDPHLLADLVDDRALRPLH